MDHRKGKKVKQVFNISQNLGVNSFTLPFSRTLRRNGRALYVTLPADYVKHFKLNEGDKLQFYVEVKL